jgi:hypothetical protein
LHGGGQGFESPHLHSEHGRNIKASELGKIQRVEITETKASTAGDRNGRPGGLPGRCA